LFAGVQKAPVIIY